MYVTPDPKKHLVKCANFLISVKYCSIWRLIVYGLSFTEDQSCSYDDHLTVHVVENAWTHLIMCLPVVMVICAGRGECLRVT